MSAPTTDAAPGGVATGVFFIAVTMFCFATMDAFAKALLERDLSSVQVTWARYIGQCLILAAVFARRLPQVARTERLGLQLMRSGFLLGATFFFFTGLGSLELADTTALMFAAPLIVTALAGPILGEKVGVWRWSAVAIGFCGMLLIVRPGGDAFQAASLIVLAAATCYAFYQISTRWLSASERPETTLLYSALLGGVVLSFVTPFFWRAPDATELAMMAACGVFGTCGQFTFILAFRAAPASVIAPFSYTSLIWATVWGALFFNTFPDSTTLIGVSVVIAAGLVILWRERVRSAQAATRKA